MNGSKNAFSFVELLIVITLISILSTIVLTKYGNMAENARKAEALSVLSEMAAAEKRYFLENSAYTTSFTALDSFSAAPYSQNFTFSLDNAASGYVEAVRGSSGSGRKSYGMCIESKKSSCCDANVCNPGCS